MGAFLSKWFMENKEYRSLPFYIIWGMWRARNARIFNQKKQDVRVSSINISTFFLEKGHVINKEPKRCIILKDIYNTFSVGLFDRASSSRRCGSGMMIVMRSGVFYMFKWCKGNDSNTREKLLAFWDILYLSEWLDIAKNDVFGDSMVIFKWANQRPTL